MLPNVHRKSPACPEAGAAKGPLPRGRSRAQNFVDRRLLAVEAIVLLAVARLLVRFVPLRHWRSLLTTAPPNPSDEPPGRRWWRLPSLAKVTQIVPKAAAAVPFRAVCLPQAMTAQWMLHRRGVRCRLLFGARRALADEPEDAAERRGQRPFLARIRQQPLDDSAGEGKGEAPAMRYHAWLVVNGMCVLGGNVDAYRALPPIDAIPRRRRRWHGSRR